MGEIKKGSEAAKEVGVALAVLYNHIRAGRVSNRLAGGWPLGKGIEVDMDEVRAAVSASKAKSSGRAPRRTKVDKDVAHAIHDELDREETNRKRAREANARGDNEQAIRLHRYNRVDTAACPVEPSHGALITAEKPAKGGRPFYCSNVAHDGRSTHHIGGFAPQTQCYFTIEETQKDGRLGVIMLEWLYAGRADLAEALETWMEKHGLEVWIPERS